MKKRVLSLFMALALCLIPLPTAALAEEYRFIRTVSVYGGGGAAAAGRAGMVGKREMAQTADGGCAGTGRHISPFFTAKAFHERGTDGSGDAGAAADLRGQEQRGDRGDPEHPGLHGQEPCEQRAQ